MPFRLMTPADVLRTVADTADAAASLPESINLLNRSLRSFAATISHLDALVQRMDRLTAGMEEPLTELAPRLRALVPLLDEELLAALPPLLHAVERTGLPALELVGQTQDQVASIASSVERLMGVMDETLGRLQGLPGANLVSRIRGGPRAEAPAGPGPAVPADGSTE
jgi:ABC-type transporter Mla subunit MlaD